jgi:hypothetical protein
MNHFWRKKLFRTREETRHSGPQGGPAAPLH